jgi:hypothetical protein
MNLETGLLLAAMALVSSNAGAQTGDTAIGLAPAMPSEMESARWSAGLRAIFMPAGQFALRYHDFNVGQVTNPRAVPALGFSLIADYSFNKLAWISTRRDLPTVRA